MTPSHNIYSFAFASLAFFLFVLFLPVLFVHALDARTEHMTNRRHYPTGSALSKEESTVINIGDPDGPPRLVSPDRLRA